MQNPYVGAGYDKYIGTRTIPGQKELEFYNLESNRGLSPDELLRTIRPYAGNQVVDESNVFDVLKAGYTPRDTALTQIKDDLNAYQQDTFNAGTDAAKRASSSITDQLASGNSDYYALTDEYNSLRKKLADLQAPNYQQAYSDLSTEAGIPQLNTEVADAGKKIRELPYVNRMNSGNAAVMTEGQLSADTAQKGIPLDIQQANLIDRLKLAQDFVNNSLKFKEMDQNAAHQSLSDAINMVSQTINLSRQHVTDLLNQQYRIEDRADAFAKANNINQRFYKLPGSDLVFDTKTQEALSYDEYKRRGGAGEPGAAFPDVQELIPQTIQEEREIVKDLATKYVDAGITLNDSLPVAQAKVQKSKIYQDQVRPPVRGGGGGTGDGDTTTKYTATSATSEIMAEWGKGYIQGNGAISSKDYKQAKDWWVNHAKLSAASFDRQFAYLIDKSGEHWKSDYGYGGE